MVSLLQLLEDFIVLGFLATEQYFLKAEISVGQEVDKLSQRQHS